MAKRKRKREKKMVVVAGVATGLGGGGGRVTGVGEVATGLWRTLQHALQIEKGDCV